MFEGVLFDLDGVITDTAHYHYLAWKELADRLGIKIDEDFNEELKGISREDSLRLILKRAGLENSVSPEEFKKLTWEKNEIYVSLIEQIGPKDVYPGILPLLKDLKKNNFKIALASASKNGPVLLAKMNLLSYFDAIADPNKIAAGKPAPDIFLEAARGLGIQASMAIGIEDAKAGIEAIKKSGALPLGVGNSKNLGYDIPIVASTSDLNLEFLKKTWLEYRS
ncbi:beta-phosphoglucomutase [Streptococcaceae bacterium ESL0687]|nr:beta-phosphoglucomutase [Streptococcaceae bacterium ESL0687]